MKIRITQNTKSRQIGLKHYLRNSVKAKYWNSYEKILGKTYPSCETIEKILVDEYKKRKIEFVDGECLSNPMNNTSFLKYLKDIIIYQDLKGKYGSNLYKPHKPNAVIAMDKK